MRRVSGLVAVRRALEGVAAVPSAARNPVLSGRLLQEAVFSTSNRSSARSNMFSYKRVAVAGTVLVSVAAATVAGGEVQAKESVPMKYRPNDVVLYQYEACPFCNKVKEPLARIVAEKETILNMNTYIANQLDLYLFIYEQVNHGLSEANKQD